MPGPYTPQYTLERLKKNAKRWLHALRAGDAEARARLERATPNAPTTPALRHVQLAVARELGYPGWASLKQAFEAEAPTSAPRRIICTAR